MEALKLRFKTGEISTLNPDQLKTGIYLWILHADKIPPHVGISIGGKYFSLKANGNDLSIPCETVFGILIKKAIPSLFVALEMELKRDPVQVFQKYPQIQVHQTTCLTPIVEVLDQDPKLNLLNALLVSLESKKYINGIFALNLKPEFEGIPNYGVQEIQNRISTIQDAKRSKRIFESH